MSLHANAAKTITEVAKAHRIKLPSEVENAVQLAAQCGLYEIKVEFISEMYAKMSVASLEKLAYKVDQDGPFVKVSWK